MNITRGKVKTAIKMLVYGPEGVGKTTFAAQMPGAVFIDTEGSTKHMDVARFDAPDDLTDVIDQLNYVLEHPKEIGTVVIDTVDWLEKLIFNMVCVEKKIQNIEDIGYGKGYVYAKQKMQQLLEMMQLIVDAGVNVCLVCHSMIRKFEQPDEMGSYDRYMLKLNEKNIAPIIKEWVDMMLFVNYRTDIVTDADGKTKKGKPAACPDDIRDLALANLEKARAEGRAPRPE
jgi:Holliday junction resolvasome RuvABC ATP-dependent DNA helicase subunit